MSGGSPLRRRIAVVALAAAGALVGPGAVGAREPPSPSASAPGEFAGAEACAACHAAAHRAWAAGNHARSTVDARGDELPPEAVDGAVVRHAPGISTFRAHGERFDVETTGPDGRPTRYPLALVVGRRRIRMYVTTLPEGRLQVLPAMREEGAGAWFDYTQLIFGAPGLAPDVAPTVAPGEPTFWTGPVRSFDAGCVRCHVSGAEAVAPAADGTGPRSRWRALGVDCEACHGPCADHVARWRDPPRGRVLDPVVRLGALDREAALSRCLACHLEGEVVARDVEPGGDVLERVDPTLLDDAERVDPSGRPLELVYEGLSFLVSRCAEAGRLSCLDCHATHGSAHGALLVASATDDGLCAACHARIAAEPGAHAHHRGDGAGARCVACHMPKVAVERGHGAVTDHTIGVPDPAGMPGVRTARDACTGCHAGARGFPSGAPALDRAGVARAFAAWWPSATRRPAWSKALAAARRGDVDALRGLEALARDAEAPRLVRASAVAQLAREPGADPQTLLELLGHEDSLVRRAAVSGLVAVRSEEADAALLAALADPSPAVRARAARGALEGWARVGRNPALLAAVIPVLAQGVSVAPNDDRAWWRLASARELAGDLVGAVEAYERQCALDPFAAASRQALARLRSRLAKPVR